MEPRDPVLFQLMCDAIAEGLDRVRGLSATTYIPTHYGWGKISYFDNGLPRFSSSWGGEPADYSTLFGDGAAGSPVSSHKRKYPIQISDLTTFEAFISHLVAQPRFAEYFTKDSPWNAENPEFSLRYQAAKDVTAVLDRYVHTYSTKTLDAKLLLPLFLEWEAGIFEKDLEVEIWVPIVITTFDFDAATLGDHVSIERIPEPMQVSRMMNLQHRFEAHPIVAAAATHAVVMRNFNITIESEVESWHVASEPAGFPEDQIDLIFAAIRATMGIDTGYAQLLLRPVGWARRWTANLPPLHATSVRKYPSRFDRGYWLEPAYSGDVTAVERVRSLIGDLGTKPNDALGAACRRLNDCFLRDRDDDALIDALIAMETLLSDDEPYELTHKLGLRAAALGQVENPSVDPVELLRRVKRLYSYRSKIVHGKRKEAEKLHAQLVKENAEPLSAAREVVRMLVRVLAKYPKFIGGTAIDQELLLRKV